MNLNVVVNCTSETPTLIARHQRLRQRAPPILRSIGMMGVSKLKTGCFRRVY